jgi:REP-associated tyrosine transposase
VNAKLAPRINTALHQRWEPVYRSRLHYLVTWSTRGRKAVLKDRHAQKLQELVPKLCEERGYELLELAIAPDHLHLLFGLKPSQSVATAVREIKSRAGLELLADHPELRVWLGGNLLWDERYSVETVSPARLEHVQGKLRHLHEASEPLERAS